ncbi:MAG TPA: VTC domain-containing protein [Dehalococcoidia bacterium]|nr:VTC domain-containing protein [Dehalococcoidia bacterium]
MVVEIRTEPRCVEAWGDPWLAHRIERKYRVDPSRLGLARGWLSHACRPALDYPSGVVTSCYYDTPELQSFYESSDGAWAKTKVRLRWYEAPTPGQTQRAFLELKSRRGLESSKRRVAVEVSGERLLARDFDGAVGPSRLRSLLAELGYATPFGLRPTAVIQYQRRRFVEVESGTRVSLDFAIRASALWAGAGPDVTLAWAVLELKGADAPLPLRLRAFGRLALPWSAHSKYGTSIEELGIQGADWD